MVNLFYSSIRRKIGLTIITTPTLVATVCCVYLIYKPSIVKNIPLINAVNWSFNNQYLIIYSIVKKQKPLTEKGVTVNG
ncbi:hypothetical protein CBF36_02750 [Vagococcus bubulae]|uniref:Uncharacterized protein n=1 Tax=Vagococcus bubulae TaxID=1977868 RepID=A0A429ZPJ1_9ENTE|nr:hypothetical protein CBF36_02750 [Vagococcus bubulae]